MGLLFLVLVFVFCFPNLNWVLFSVLSVFVAVAFSAIARIFYLCRLALAYAILKQITSSPKGKTL